MQRSRNKASAGEGKRSYFFGGTWQPLRVAVDEESKTEHPNRLLKRMSVL